MLRFPIAGRYPSPVPESQKNVQPRYQRELTVKWPNPSGAKRPICWYLPYGGRFHIGNKDRCELVLADFPWSRFILFLQDGLNGGGIDLHLIEGMRATIASPLGTELFGPTNFGRAEWSDFQHYWRLRLPEKCCGRIVAANTTITFQRGLYPYKYLPPRP